MVWDASDLNIFLCCVRSESFLTKRACGCCASLSSTLKLSTSPTSGTSAQNFRCRNTSLPNLTFTSGQPTNPKPFSASHARTSPTKPLEAAAACFADASVCWTEA